MTVCRGFGAELPIIQQRDLTSRDRYFYAGAIRPSDILPYFAAKELLRRNMTHAFIGHDA